MADIDEKHIFIGDTGNTAMVTEEEKSTRTLPAQAAQRHMAQAGEVFCPFGFTYMGSATVHYYSKVIDGGENPEFSHACQVNLGNTIEGHADLGWKSLQAALMKAYGREEPRTNKK